MITHGTALVKLVRGGQDINMPVNVKVRHTKSTAHVLFYYLTVWISRLNYIYCTLLLSTNNEKEKKKKQGHQLIQYFLFF